MLGAPRIGRCWSLMRDCNLEGGPMDPGSLPLLPAPHCFPLLLRVCGAKVGFLRVLFFTCHRTEPPAGMEGSLGINAVSYRGTC